MHLRISIWRVLHNHELEPPYFRRDRGDRKWGCVPTSVRWNPWVGAVAAGGGAQGRPCARCALGKAQDGGPHLTSEFLSDSPLVFSLKGTLVLQQCATVERDKGHGRKPLWGGRQKLVGLGARSL